jgi:hypothetical protein
MSNFTITNKQGSILSLSPLQDENGVALVLHPAGSQGASKTISAETAEHEIVERVKKANWVSVTAVGAVAAPKAAVVAPPPPPAPPAPVAVTPEATQVMPPAEVETLVERTKEPEPEAASEPPPMPEPPVKRSRK